MSREIIQFDQAMFESKLDAMVREKVERIVNAMPDASGGRDRQRREIRAFRRTEGVPGRSLRAEPDRQGRQARAQGAEIEGRPVRVRGDRTLPQTRGKRRGGADRHVPGRRVHQAGRRHRPVAVGGDCMPSRTLSDKLKRVYAEIDEWRTGPLEGEYPYVFVDGVWHKRSWGGSVENVGILVAIGVSKDGHREAVGVAEGMREDSASWERFFRGMIERGLKGVRLVVGDRCAGLVSTVNSTLPKAGYQRRMVHFIRNVLSKVPPGHRRRIRTNDERLNREIGRRARRGKLPGREQRAHARLRAHQVRHRERMVQPALPRHVPARWQSAESELIIAPWTGMIQSAQPFGHYRAFLRLFQEWGVGAFERCQ